MAKAIVSKAKEFDNVSCQFSLGDTGTNVLLLCIG